MLLRVSYIWHGEVLRDLVLTRPRPVTLGSHKRATITTPGLGLPPRFVVLRPGSRGYVLTLGSKMSGALRVGEEELDVTDFLARGAGAGADAGFRATTVAPGDWGVVHLDGRGEHTLFFHFVPREAQLPRPPARLGELGPALAFAITLIGLLLTAVFLLRPERHSFVFPGDRALLARYLVRRPPPPLPPAPAAPRAGTAEGEKAAPAASTAGAEGKAGGEGKTERARAPDPDAGKSEAPLPETIQTGLLSRRSQKTLKAVLDRGGFDKKLGAAVARLQGTANLGGAMGSGDGAGTGVGAGTGTGTLTRGGTGGPGGGGTAHADLVSQGAIKTGGTRAPRGMSGGSGVKEVAVSLKTGNPDGDFGGLSQADVERVVRARANAIRACYERQLQRDRSLSGKVAVQWKIDASGKVMLARVRNTTMRNGSVEDCIVRQVQSMRFPSHKGVAVVTFPFVFAPQ
jgi:hypothetical protein